MIRPLELGLPYFPTNLFLAREGSRAIDETAWLKMPG